MAFIIHPDFNNNLLNVNNLNNTEHKHVLSIKHKCNTERSALKYALFMYFIILTLRITGHIFCRNKIFTFNFIFLSKNNNKKICSPSNIFAFSVIYTSSLTHYTHLLPLQMSELGSETESVSKLFRQ